MAGPQARSLLRHLHELVGAGGTDSVADAELVQRFVARQDERAFEALVRRHGPAVLRLCRHLLGHEQDAEDAFQATFLVFTRKAAALRARGSVGSWLYGVAYRVALRARAGARQRRACESQVRARPPEEVVAEVSVREAQAILDEELARLPPRYRDPLVLCCLQGKARDEAARQLGWSLGRLKNCLEQGRARLRSRLARRGLTLPAGLLAALLADKPLAAAVSLSLVRATVEAARLVAQGRGLAGIVSPAVAVLAKGALQVMLWNKVRTVAVVLVLMGLVGLGTPTLTRWALHGQDAVPVSPAGGGAGAAAAELPAAAPQPEAAATPPEGDPAQEAKDRLQSQNNLKQIALALHNYHDTYQRFPAPAIYSGMGGMEAAGPMGGLGPGIGVGAPPVRGPADMGGLGPGGEGAMGMVGVGKGGKALLSWRVALLPYLGEDKLYREFKLQEPWDSPHNKKLLARRPKVYAAPGTAGKDPVATYYQGFVGPGAFFEKHRAFRIADITDGTSNTLMIVEAGAPVPWTKPEDLVYDPDQPLPQLGGLFGNVFHVALCDGAVLALNKEAPEDGLRSAITRSGGEVLDLPKVLVRGAGIGKHLSAAQLKEENRRLQQALHKAAQDLEAMKRELVVAKEMAQLDRESARLLGENLRLQTELAKILEETQALRQEIDKINKSRSGGK